jgi:hypothetical protein
LVLSHCNKHQKPQKTRTLVLWDRPHQLVFGRFGRWRADTQHLSTERCYAHRVEAGISPLSSALQAPIRNEASHEVGGGRAVDSRCYHDVGLAEAALIGNCLQNRELARREVAVPDLAGEQTVSPLAGTVQ